MVLTQQVIDNTAQFVNILFTDNPCEEDLTEEVKKYELDVIKQRLVTLKQVKKDYADNKLQLPAHNVPQIDTLISVMENITDPSKRKTTEPDEPHPKRQRPDLNETNDDLNESSVHLANDDKDKEKARKLFNITQPKNLKLQIQKRAISHIFDWEPKPRSMIIYVTGPEYKPGEVFNILNNSDRHFGIIPDMNEHLDHALINCNNDGQREIIMEIINNDPQKITAETSSFRRPIIKFEVDFPITEQDVPNILSEIKKFNLKKFSEGTFEKHRIYRLPGTPFTVICVIVDPKIRDYIIEEGQGRIWFRSKSRMVQDYFNVRKCYDCGLTNHSNCTNKQRRCLRCSGPHKRSSCSSIALRCPACSGPHEAFTIYCPNFVKAIDKEMNTIDYTYTKVMWSPMF